MYGRGEIGVLEKIEYSFPQNKESKEFFELLFALFGNLKNATVFGENEICFSSGLKPKTVFRLENKIADLQLNIGNKKYLDWLTRKSEDRKVACEVRKLEMKEVANKLAGHVLRVDHTGINFPASLYAEEEWQELLKYFSSVSNVYAYPTGEPWPFLIPATQQENESEITNFEILREPRFELVYDKFTDVVAIQIDVETDLSKSEVEALFPKNEGIYFKHLENFFKSIYLDYNENVDIRLDVRFQTVHDDFESGEWFVKDGKRM